MLVIIITILSQGPRVPQELRGDLKGSLVIKSGVSQAIGVISFGIPFRILSRSNTDFSTAFVCRM